MPPLQLDDFLPFRLSVASNAVSRVIASAYESRFGLKAPEWRLIAVLAEREAFTPQAIAERTVMDKVTVSRAAQSLLARRLIERRPNAVDGRSHHLSLTDEGRRLHAVVMPLAQQFERSILESFSDAERAGLMDLLKRLEASAEEVSLCNRSQDPDLR